MFLGQHKWGGEGSVQTNFYVLPLLPSMKITDTQVQEDVSFSGHLGHVNSLMNSLTDWCVLVLYRFDLFSGHGQL